MMYIHLSSNVKITLKKINNRKKCALSAQVKGRLRRDEKAAEAV